MRTDFLLIIAIQWPVVGQQLPGNPSKEVAQQLLSCSSVVAQESLSSLSTNVQQSFSSRSAVGQQLNINCLAIAEQPAVGQQMLNNSCSVGT